jgi:hypothetical protein
MDTKGKKENTKEINAVHLDEIHVENIKKEHKYEGKNFKYDYTFQTKNLFPFAEKPQLVAPNRPFTSQDTINRQSKREWKLNRDPISDAFVNERISKIILQNQQIPKDKYEYPQTSAQEIGWFSKPLVNNARWDHSHRSTPISQYVDSYFITMKINPFKLPTSTIKMK